MPRFTKKSSKNRTLGGRSAYVNGNAALSPQAYNWFITMTRVHGTHYIEKFKTSYKPCHFIEWYYELNEDQTFNIYAYAQFSFCISLSTLCMKLNCRTSYERTTIADKLMSAFNAVPNKKCLGIERTGAERSVRGAIVGRSDLEPVDIAVKIDKVLVKKPVCWLKPNPVPKIDFKALLARCEPATNKGPVLN